MKQTLNYLELRNYAKIHVFQKHPPECSRAGCKRGGPSMRNFLGRLYPFFEKDGLSKNFVIYSN